MFFQPWLGDTIQTEKEGYFGLYESCKYTQQGSNPNSYRIICEGTWASISSSVNPTATFCIGFSALINLISIAVFLVLFLFINPGIVFTICGILQLFSSEIFDILNLVSYSIDLFQFIFILKAFFMILGCVIYPNNWDDPRIVDICETSTSYYSGKCAVRWAYILAIIGIFDIWFLAALALVLSRRQVNNYKVASMASFSENNLSYMPENNHGYNAENFDVDNHFVQRPKYNAHSRNY